LNEEQRRGLFQILQCWKTRGKLEPKFIVILWE
jgi:hypothetical protein